MHFGVKVVCNNNSILCAVGIILATCVEKCRSVFIDFVPIVVHPPAGTVASVWR